MRHSFYHHGDTAKDLPRQSSSSAHSLTERSRYLTECQVKTAIIFNGKTLTGQQTSCNRLVSRCWVDLLTIQKYKLQGVLLCPYNPALLIHPLIIYYITLNMTRHSLLGILCLLPCYIFWNPIFCNVHFDALYQKLNNELN